MLYHFGQSKNNEVTVHHLASNQKWNALSFPNFNITGKIQSIVPYTQSYCPTMKNDDCQMNHL